MPPVIHAENLTKIFGNNTAVDHISFDVYQGEIFGFLGPNGAGKTTTTRMLTGVIPPDAGVVIILGYNVWLEPVLAKQKIGVVPETSNAYTDLTAWQNLMLMGELYGLAKNLVESRSSELLRMVGLSKHTDQKVQTFSKGMKQRLILAMALISEPELLFLDEPTSGLDVQSSHMIISLLQELNQQGTTIFLTTHNMEEANRLCHRVGIISNGKIITIDAPEKLKTTIDREHIIEVSFDREVPGETLANCAGITGADRSGDKWIITTGNRDTAIRSLVSLSERQGATIITLSTLAPSLDEAFIQLIKEKET